MGIYFFLLFIVELILSYRFQDPSLDTFFKAAVIVGIAMLLDKVSGIYDLLQKVRGQTEPVYKPPEVNKAPSPTDECIVSSYEEKT